MRNALSMFIFIALAACVSVPSGSSSSAGGSSSGGLDLNFCYAPKAPAMVPTCDCYPDERDRSAADYDIVTSCGGTDGEQCFADKRTTGEVTVCECFVTKCWRDASGYCECNHNVIGNLDTSTAKEVPNCGPTPDIPYCCLSADGQACGCQGGYCGGDRHEVSGGCDIGKLSPINDKRTPVDRCR